MAWRQLKLLAPCEAVKQNVVVFHMLVSCRCVFPAGLAMHVLFWEGLGQAFAAQLLDQYCSWLTSGFYLRLAAPFLLPDQLLL